MFAPILSAVIGLVPKLCSYSLTQDGNIYIHHCIPARSVFVPWTRWKDLEAFLLQLRWLLVGEARNAAQYPVVHRMRGRAHDKEFPSPKCLSRPGGETLMYVHTDARFVTS